jgi:hypothetical protein
MSVTETQPTATATEPHGFAELARAIAEVERENARTHALLAEQLMRLEHAAGHVEPDPPVKAPHRPKRPAVAHEAGAKPIAGAPAITYRVTSPMMKSRQLRGFQRLLNRRYREWRIDYRVDDDGEYGPETRRAAKRVAFALGIAARELEHGLTPEVRRKIRHPELRSPPERARAERRLPWLARLRKRYEGGGPEAALRYAHRHLGVTESPPASNRGPLIDRWNRAVGTPPGPNAFWCGAFVNACLVAAGFTPKPWMKSCVQIEEHARGRVEGWSWHASPRPGDLVLYTEKGVAGHVGMVERLAAGTLVTIEGNTSRQGASSSQSNGGGVFERRRNPHDPSFPVRGYARPPYRG